MTSFCDLCVDHPYYLLLRNCICWYVLHVRLNWEWNSVHVTSRTCFTQAIMRFIAWEPQLLSSLHESLRPIESGLSVGLLFDPESIESFGWKKILSVSTLVIFLNGFYWVYVSVSGRNCFWGILDVLGVYQCMWVYLTGSQCIWAYLTASECISMYLTVSQCIWLYLVVK